MKIIKNKAIINKTIMNKATHFLLVIGLIALGSCASSNTINFYALQSTLANTTGSSSNLNSHQSIGISRVLVPDYMKNQGVTSLTKNKGQLNIALTHAWAGKIDTQLTQVIAQDVGKIVNRSAVWPSPWPHGVKPDIRVQVVVEQLAGILTQQVIFRAKWIISNKDNNTIASGVFNTEVAVQDSSTKANYGAYTYAMSQAVGQLSTLLAEQIQQNKN